VAEGEERKGLNIQKSTLGAKKGFAHNHTGELKKGIQTKTWSRGKRKDQRRVAPAGGRREKMDRSTIIKAKNFSNGEGTEEGKRSELPQSSGPTHWRRGRSGERGRGSLRKRGGPI